MQKCKSISDKFLTNHSFNRTIAVAKIIDEDSIFKNEPIMSTL